MAISTIRNDIYTYLVTSPLNAEVNNAIAWVVDINQQYPCVVMNLSRKKRSDLTKSELAPLSLIVQIIAKDIGSLDPATDAAYFALERQVFGSIVSCQMEQAMEGDAPISGDPENILYYSNLTFSIYAKE